MTTTAASQRRSVRSMAVRKASPGTIEWTSWNTCARPKRRTSAATISSVSSAASLWRYETNTVRRRLARKNSPTASAPMRAAASSG